MTHTITPHLVVRDAARAADWHTGTLGAEERGRIPVAGRKLMQVDLVFGDTTVMLADEFEELGVLSPLSIGGSATVLHLASDDVDALWERAVAAGAEVRQPLADALLGRALRPDHRPVRPSLGSRAAHPRRSAGGDRGGGAGALRRLTCRLTPPVEDGRLAREARSA